MKITEYGKPKSFLVWGLFPKNVNSRIVATNANGVEQEFYTVSNFGTGLQFSIPGEYLVAENLPATIMCMADGKIVRTISFEGQGTSPDNPALGSSPISWSIFNASFTTPISFELGSSSYYDFADLNSSYPGHSNSNFSIGDGDSQLLLCKNPGTYHIEVYTIFSQQAPFIYDTKKVLEDCHLSTQTYLEINGGYAQPSSNIDYIDTNFYPANYTVTSLGSANFSVVQSMSDNYTIRLSTNTYGINSAGEHYLNVEDGLGVVCKRGYVILTRIGEFPA